MNLWRCTYVSALVFVIFSSTPAKVALEESDLGHRTNLTHLITVLKREEDFKTLLVLRQRDTDCDNGNLLQELNEPRVLLQTIDTATPWNWYLKAYYNSQLLVLVCLTHVELRFIAVLANELQHLRTSRILFVWNQSETDLDHIRGLNNLAAYCKQFEMFNFIIVLRDFYQQCKYYSFRQYPHLELETHSSCETPDTIFESSLKKFHGQPLLTASDWVEPRSMLYLDTQNREYLAGYMSKLLLTFAEKLNSTLKFPFTTEEPIYLRDLLSLTRNKTIDLAMSLSNPKIEMNMQEYSYPVEIVRWIPMLPVEKDIPMSEMFFKIVADVRVCLCIVLLMMALSTLLTWTTYGSRGNLCRVADRLSFSRTLRGLLGQSFDQPMRQQQLTYKLRLVVLLILVSGFIITNMYLAYLNAYLVQLPSQRRINTFEDLLQSNIKILISAKEVPTLITNKGKQFWQRYSSCFKIIDSFNEFVRLRKSLNTSYGYTVTTSLWPVIERQQKFFCRRIFRLSNQMVFDNFAIVGLPIGENSIYKTELNQFIEEMKAFGLIQHWFEMTYFDMVAAGKIDFHDLSVARPLQPMKLQDLHWIGILYIIANLLALFIFVLEHRQVEWRFCKISIEWMRSSRK